MTTAHADDDAEHRQEAAELVRPHAVERHRKISTGMNLEILNFMTHLW